MKKELYRAAMSSCATCATTATFTDLFGDLLRRADEPTPPPPSAKPPEPAEVFTVPGECWQCRHHYECHICPHGLKEPLVIGRRYGKRNAL